LKRGKRERKKHIRGGPCVREGMTASGEVFPSNTNVRENNTIKPREKTSRGEIEKGMGKKRVKN